MDEIKIEQADKPKYPKSLTAESEKPVPVKHMTQEEYSRHIQKDLISKAYTIFGWTLFLLFAVFVMGFFFDGDGDLVSEIIRIFFSILTFLLGYLFATIRN